MTASTITESATTPATPTPKLDPRALTDSAAELLNAMAALPAGHPSRAALRDRAIEAWLPLANHLAHRYSVAASPPTTSRRPPPSASSRPSTSSTPPAGSTSPATRSPPSSAS